MNYESTGFLIKNLSDKSKKILELIKINPQISAKEIKKKLNIGSTSTFTLHVNPLLKNELIKYKKNFDDKRQKLFEVTGKGAKINILVSERALSNSLNFFFEYCKNLYININPQFVNTHIWNDLINDKALFDKDFIVNLRKMVYNKIDEYIQNNQLQESNEKEFLSITEEKMNHSLHRQIAIEEKEKNKKKEIRLVQNP